MGRSRITRTYHNKPVSKSSNKTGSNTRITATKAAKMAQKFKKTKTTKPTTTRSVSKTTKQKASSTQAKSKSKGLIPQAHAQEASEQQTKSKKEPLEGQNLGHLNVNTQIISRHTQNQGSHNYHGFTPLHGDGPHNSNWSLGSDDLKGISGRTKRINEQRVGYHRKQQGSHLDQSRAITQDGKDVGIIETVVRTKTGFRAFGPGTSHKGQKSISLSKSNIKKETYASGEPVNVQYGMNPYTPASDTEGRALDKKYYPDETATGKERTILGKFAQGVGNEAQDIGGVPYGLVTGQDYKTKSILSRATEHAFAGDWDSAGKVISDNPYRFAGNVATNIGLSIIPFGMVARGAGLAGKAGGVISKGLSKGGKGKKIAMKAIRAEEKRTGKKFSRSQIRNILDDTPTVKDVRKKTLTEMSIQKQGFIEAVEFAQGKGIKISKGSFMRDSLITKKPSKRSNWAFATTTVPKHVGIGYDEYY